MTRYVGDVARDGDAGKRRARRRLGVSDDYDDALDGFDDGRVDLGRGP